MFQSPARTESFAPPEAPEERIRLPGYGLPLDYAPLETNVYGIQNRSLFPTALDDRDIQKGYADQPLLTLREIDMLKVMERITDRRNWHEEVFNQEMTKQWRTEALADPRVDITSNMVDWVIDELKYKAKIYAKCKVLSLYNGDVVKSDIAVPDALRSRLKEASTALENVTDLEPYVVPTIGKQLDIIPVTLFPLVYGRSRILPDSTIGIDDALLATRAGEIIPQPQDIGFTREDIAWRVAARADIHIQPYSADFQLLPCDLRFSEDGRWEIQTYINNLHPKNNRAMYKIIEEIFNHLIPLWNACLTPLRDVLHSRPRIEFQRVEYLATDPEMEKTRPLREPDELDSNYEQRRREWEFKHCHVVQPDAGKFQPWAVPPYMMEHLPQDLPNPIRVEQGVELNKDYGKRGLQLIVRLTKVEVKPNDPEFSSEWHVEGQLNEHICATSFFCYEKENMGDCPIAFRQLAETAVLGQVKRDPNDVVFLKQVFGLESGLPAVQEVGQVNLEVGRVVMVPSTLQHKKVGWKLLDNSRPGYIKYLVFFLVDPNIRIISTANVPPQRLDWSSELGEVERIQEVFGKFTLNMRDRMMARKDGFPFTFDEGVKFREDMVKERINFTTYQQVAFESNLVFL